MTPILILALLAPVRPKQTDYVKMLNEDQQIINKLTSENQLLRTQLYGSPGERVDPRFVNEQPTCPVNGFELKWSVESSVDSKVFRPYCVRMK